MRRFTGRGLLRAVLLLVVPTVGIAVALHWYAKGARWAVTDNAYVKAHLVSISAEIPGRVAEVAVRDQQRVEKGALLFRIDPLPYELALRRARAQLAVTRTEIETLRSEYRGAVLDADEAGERIGFLEKQMERQRTLKEKGMSRVELYDEALNTLEIAKKQIGRAHV